MCLNANKANKNENKNPSIKLQYSETSITTLVNDRMQTAVYSQLAGNWLNSAEILLEVVIPDNDDQMMMMMMAMRCMMCSKNCPVASMG